MIVNGRLRSLVFAIVCGCRAESDAPRVLDEEIELRVRARPELVEQGIHVEKATRAREHVSLHTEFKKPFKGTVWIFILDEKGIELGRARTEVARDSGFATLVFSPSGVLSNARSLEVATR
jgi:hypothetical protein